MSYQNIILTGITVALSVLVILIARIHQTGISRQMTTLRGVAQFPVSRSDYYVMAQTYLSNIQSPDKRRGYVIPIFALFVLVFFYSAIAYFGPQMSLYLSTPNYILGGTYLLQAHSSAEIALYQSSTLLIITVAFVGAYLYILNNLASRINNNDIAPIVYYYYCIRIVIATLLAGVVRHLLEFIDPAMIKSSYWLVVIGFAIGWAPMPWLTLLVSKVSKKIGIIGQPDPDPANVPSNFSLLLIEGITEDKRNRLGELDIDNCQALAGHNPFVIWARTPYQLLHILDWLAQAQLCVLVGDTGIRKLREIAVRNIFGFAQVLSGDGAGKIANILNAPPEIMKDILASMQANPSFKRLKEVYDLLGSSDNGQGANAEDG